MINIESSYPNPVSQGCMLAMRNDKIYNFQRDIRSRQIEEYRQKIRAQKQAIEKLNFLLEDMPKELQSVLQWCKNTINQFSISESLEFPTFKIVEFFKLVEKFPCPQTIQILRIVSTRISIAGIHELFQYDIVGFLHRIMTLPEKVTTRTLKGQFDFKEVQLNLVKDSMMILAALSEKSQRAKNFIVVNHKTFLCVKKAQKKFGSLIENQLIIILCSFFKNRVQYDQQFVRIIRATIQLFCYTLNISDLRRLTQALTNVLKIRQKWALDMIESTITYNILEKILDIFQMVRNKFENKGTKQHDYCEQKQLGLLCHQINIFIMYYIQISTNQQFQWKAFFQQWFYILGQHQYSFFAYFTQTRQAIYFIISNNLSDIDEMSSFSHIFENIIMQFDCIKVLTANLELQSNQDAIQELVRAMGGLFNFGQVQVMAESILKSSTIQIIIETILNKSLILKDSDAIQVLVNILLTLLHKTKDNKLKATFACKIQNYESQLQSYSNTVNQLQSKAIEQLQRQIKNITQINK